LAYFHNVCVINFHAINFAENIQGEQVLIDSQSSPG